METKWIWPFELLDKLGEGGMGVVYRARYVGNNKQVAVKLLPEDVTANATLLGRFERELEVLKQLKHPNIVNCFGGSCESKQRFYAMELISGGTLAEYLGRKGRLPWETAIDFAIQMCDGLQYAHEHGVIHRDVKPGNFLMTKSGQLKLSDFGLASIVSENRLTAAGRTVGTILYMAPEQIRGTPAVTPRADLYALGCVIFEMIVGRPPFSGDHAAEILQRHLKDPIPHLVRDIPDCPLELDALVFELLSKDAEQRPASAADVSKRLHGILLPSRRETASELEFFGKRAPKTLPIAALKNLKPNSSDADVWAKPRRISLWSGYAWIVVGILICVCIVLTRGWLQTARRLRQTEQTWVEMFESPDPRMRGIAAKELIKFGALQTSTIQMLHKAANSIDDDLQIASMQVLAGHPTESGTFQAELLRIQKSDENPNVRDQAGRTLSALQSAQLKSPWWWSIWIPILAFVAAVSCGGYWFWNKAKQFAHPSRT